MKKIAICGSSKNHTFITRLKEALEAKGFYIYLFPDARHLFQLDVPPMAYKLMAAGLTYDHFEKIKKADCVLFANLAGYMGNSATLELGCAASLSKHIIALNHDDELARECLFNDVLETEDIENIVKILSSKWKA